MAAIEARELAKCYRIYRRPHDRLLEWAWRGRRRYADEVWALRDVDFEVPAGMTLGIIGENGAGKSTLLQIVAGTLLPTSGHLAVKGRLSAILDLGAGFHPELTGRENTLIAGSVLGFSSREMAGRVEAIAAFAEIGEFLDRPVKTYSSGMFVRLAFAVATCVDPEILVIDEVLTVGDQYFQKKCIDRIEAFRKAGKTILFCSHNLYQVRYICDHALWLHEGRIALLGETAKVVDAYETALRERTARQAAGAVPAMAPEPTPAGQGPRITRVVLQGGAGEPQSDFQTGEPLQVTVAYEVPHPPTALHVGVDFYRNDGVQCFATATHVEGIAPPAESAAVTFTFPRLQLLAGEYDVSVYLLDDSGLHVYDQRRREFRFIVHHQVPALGMVYLDHRWEVPAGGGEGTPATLSVIAPAAASGPWAELCQEALTRHTPELLERVSMDGGATVGEALEKTRGEVVALLHPAIAVAPGWAGRLIRALRVRGAGAVGPLLSGAGGQRLAAGYHDARGFLEAAARQATLAEGPREVETLDAGCWLAPRALLADLPPATPLSEAPAALRAAGLPLLCVPSVLVHTFADYFAQGRPEIIDLIPPDARRILDVGCGAGGLGQTLKGRREVTVVGIEKDPDAAAAARAVLDRVIECDLDQALPELEPSAFDCLVFADVLEHFKDPWVALRGLVPSLRPGGTLVACLPNVRHWSVLRGLLEGEWRYVPAGLLDQGHLRFFTRATAEELFTRAGLVVRSVHPLTAEGPPDLTRLAAALKAEGLRVETLAEEARVVQFLFVAERPAGEHGR